MKNHFVASKTAQISAEIFYKKLGFMLSDLLPLKLVIDP